MDKQRRPYKEVRTAFRRKRIENDMSVRDVALALGVTQTCVYLWELGEHLPTGRRIIELARLYHCTTYELLGVPRGMTPYRYIRGGERSREAVEWDIKRGGQYITTCVVDVDLLICGIRAFPCGNGDDVKLTPEQRLAILETVQEERRRILDRYPVKTYKGWYESGLPTFEDYCKPGDEVDEELVDYFVNSVPPVLMLSFCTQAGEPYSSEPGDERNCYRPTFTTFHDLGGGRWRFDGYCFYKENVNRVNRGTRLEQRIEEARREVTE